MPNYRFPGRPTATTHTKNDYLGIELKPYLSTRVDTTRGRGESVDSPETGEADVIKITLDSGIELWTSVKQAEADYGVTAKARGGERLVVPHDLGIGEANRGAGRWLVKALDLFTVDVVDEAAKAIAAKLEAKLESRLAHGGSGLYLFGKDAKPESRIDTAKDMAGGPSLVFIHGTASSSEGGFGRMPEQKSAWEEIFKSYGGRVFAFEHRTLSLNPIENAIELAEALPDGAEFDLISHSRGGLVAELLCRSARVDGNGAMVAAFDELDFKIFQNARQDAATGEVEITSLKKLNALLAQKKFKIRQLVRAGCPARGTTLASGRLDRYLSLVVNGLKLIPALTVNPVYDLTMGLLLAVAKQRTDPKELPGLEAQMPESPLIRMLNRADVNLSNRLTVIAGDIEGSGVWGRLKVLATDLFYLEQHDLVVNTSAMYGGAWRRGSDVAMFDQGADVNHFDYFARKKTAKGIADALNLRLTEKDGFKPIAAFIQPPPPTRAAAVERKRPLPVVFILPGTMGSRLEVKGVPIWFDAPRIATGGIAGLTWNGPDVKEAGVFEDYYSALSDYLSASHETVAFGYDWRQSILTEGARLAIAVEKKMKETAQPIRFIGHSTGGLVVRAMAVQKPDLWARIMHNPGGRFVMLGTPNKGACSTVTTLLGRDKTIRLIELFDVTHDMNQLLTMVSAFPGVLELLPRDGSSNPYLPATWAMMRGVDKAEWAAPAAAALAAAEKTWQLLGGLSLSGRNLAYVAGRSPHPTPAELRFDAGNKFSIAGTRQGDGRVTWSSGQLPGVTTWFADAAHGDLPRHEKSFDAYLDLLSTGQTTRLPTSPPAEARAAIAAPEEIKDTPIEVYPSEKDLMDAVMGAAPRPEGLRGPVSKIRIKVVHGDLAFAHYPVVVGHYERDTIRGAEAALDRHLDRRMSRKRTLGLYAGRLESAELILDEQGRPPGALVIGLGPFGDLSPGGLRRTYAYGLKKYADISADGRAGKQSLQLSTLLIGHRESRLSLRDAVSSMMDGLIDVKDELAALDEFKDAEFADIEIVELYEDMAIAALRVLRDLQGDTRFKENLEIELRLGTVGGKRRRIAPSEGAEWARKIQIRGGDEGCHKGSLVFTVLDGSARATEVSLATQAALIDPYINSLTAQTVTDKAVSETLFELLTPKEFKAHAAEDRDIVLILDPAAAAYPWELLDDRLGFKNEPMVVRGSCIRQLIDVRPTLLTGRAMDKTAVVIGDSVSPEGSGFVELEGAQKEAEAVAELLRSSGEGYDPKLLIKKSCAEITDALLRSGRIMHIAAHGVYEHAVTEADGTPRMVNGKPQAVTGMVLGGGAFFTAAEVDQIRPFPELVFLNCCYLGKIAPADKEQKVWNDRHRLAGNLAHQFILNGAKAVVAAGWAVNDNAALIFAKEFYSTLLGGATFAQAVKAGRGAAHDANPNCNTWGAYQCYGDPDYQLVARSAGGAVAGQKLLSQAEAVIELENLSSRAATASLRKLADARGDIEQLVEQVSDWLGKSAVQEGLAKAYAKADQFDKAIAAYEAALRASDAESSLKAIEQLANLRAKHAAAELRALKAKDASTFEGKNPVAARAEALRNQNTKSIRDLNNAKDQIGALKKALSTSGLGDGATVERYSLVGSAIKRIAAIKPRRQRGKLLKQAIDAYHAACLIASKPGGGQAQLYYPGLNKLLLEALAALNAHAKNKTWAAITADQAELLKACRENAANEDRTNPEFYILNARFDALIVEALLDGKLESRIGEAVGLFKAAWRRGGSHLELRAVMEQFEFIEECLQGIDVWPRGDNLLASVSAIRETIERLTDEKA